MTYRVRPLKCGEVLAPGPAVYLQRDYDRSYLLNVYVWLIEGGGRRILVDTGPGDPAEVNAARDPDRHWHVEPVAGVLRRAGVHPEEIDTLVLSHLHHDHAGNVALFRQATVILAEREWEFVRNPPHPALAPHPLFPKPAIDYLASLSSARLRLVSGNCPVVPGIAVSVLGAHTPGSLATKVATDLGELILAGDVIFTYRNLKEAIPIGTLLHVPEWYAAWRELSEAQATVLPSHDRALEQYR
jgi:glyoxylase-like metal-dependent hydrolase (beta-lactamase superfamily II)